MTTMTSRIRLNSRPDLHPVDELLRTIRTLVSAPPGATRWAPSRRKLGSGLAIALIPVDAYFDVIGERSVVPY